MRKRFRRFIGLGIMLVAGVVFWLWVAGESGWLPAYFGADLVFFGWLWTGIIGLAVLTDGRREWLTEIRKTGGM